MPRVVHFEITAAAPKQSAEFYSRVFGWAMAESQFMPDYFLLGPKDEQDGAVMDRSHVGQPVIAWFEVPALEPALATVEAAGGRRVNAINSIPGVGRLVYAADPEGVVFGLKELPAVRR